MGYMATSDTSLAHLEGVYGWGAFDHLIGSLEDLKLGDEPSNI